jgi:hypothetical protein
MKKLVSVAEPSLQKNPDLFLDRLKEKMRSHKEWEDQPGKARRESGDNKKNGSEEKHHGCA